MVLDMAFLDLLIKHCLYLREQSENNTQPVSTENDIVCIKQGKLTYQKAKLKLEAGFQRREQRTN